MGMSDQVIVIKFNLLHQRINDLVAQNQRYRKALEEIGNHKHTQDCFRFKATIVYLNNCEKELAQQALSEESNEPR